MDPLWTVDNLAEYLQVTPNAIYTWRSRGGGPPAIIVGKRHVRFDPEVVREWLKGGEVK